jgi:predicted alpha/beta hydrolase family esterase
MLVLWVHMVFSPDVSNALEALDARAADNVLSAGAALAHVRTSMFRDDVDMSPAPVELLFIQGAGSGAHEADRVLFEALGELLGPGFRIHFPRMPDEAAPDNDVWKRRISTSLRETRATFLVAHSAGAALVADMLVDNPADELVTLGGLLLLAPPFVGRGGWALDGFHLDGAVDRERLRALPLQFWFGLDDTTVPPTHSELYAARFPDAIVHRLPGCSHQFEHCLGSVADALRHLASATRA